VSAGATVPRSGESGHEPRRSDGLLLALSLFTVVPVRRSGVAGSRRATRDALLLGPAVGFGIGALAGSLALAATHLSGSGLLGAALGVGVIALATRGLHLDGLADTVDGLGSFLPPDRALEVMRRGDVGPLGVTALVLVLLIDTAALSATAHPVVAAGVAAATGRLAVTLAATRGTPPARPDGLGASVAGTVPRRGAGLAVAGTLATAALIALWVQPAARGRVVTVLAVVAGLAVASVLRRHAVGRLGGVTGDVLGALVEVSTCAALVVAACAA
jgi:adenosylcobinamide-GDP ribazoletransferase